LLSVVALTPLPLRLTLAVLVSPEA